MWRPEAAHSNLWQQVDRKIMATSALDTTVQRAQFLSTFIDSFLPAREDGVDRGNIIDSLPSLLGQSQLLDNAITALCTIFVGVKNDDGCLQQAAMRLYSCTLKDMLCAIRRVSKPTDDILYTTVVLGYYEVSYLYLLH